MNTQQPDGQSSMTIAEANREFRDQQGRSLEELSRGRSCLVVFLRHSGCTFCREALADIKAAREELESRGVLPVLVHMGDESAGAKMARPYGLDDLPLVSDPERRLYRAYGLQRGGVGQLLGPSVWRRGFEAAILSRHGLGTLGGDGFQMPGVFLIRDGAVLREFRHRTAADRPEYCSLAAGEPAE